MDLNIKWHKPINLIDGGKENLIYLIRCIGSSLDFPGVYMFARIYNGVTYPLYIGKAESIEKRVWQHFKNNVKLMNSIKNAAKGLRVFIPGQFTPKPGQNTKKCIALIEKALIDHALTEGYELFNIQGTRTPAHQVCFSGFLGARNITGKSLSFKAKGNNSSKPIALHEAA